MKKIEPKIDFSPSRKSVILPASLVGLTMLLGTEGQTQSLFSASSGPLYINAKEGIEYNESEKYYRATGEATVRREGLEVIANNLTAFFRDSDNGPQVFRIVAEGAVYVESDGAKLNCEVLEALVEEDWVRAVGNPVVYRTPDGGQLTANESLVYDGKNHYAEARGSAQYSLGEQILSASALRASFLSEEEQSSGQGEGVVIRQIQAEGSVQITDSDTLVLADQAVYSPISKIASLEGNVNLTQGTTQVAGPKAEVNVGTGVYRIVGPTAVKLGE